MRSDLLLKLTQTHLENQDGPWENVSLTGPHDLILIRLCQAQQTQQNFKAINAAALGFDPRIFSMALKYLEKQGYLKGVVYTYQEDDPYPTNVDLSQAQVTAAGEAYEKKLG
nr:hypothetical protein [uncultured Anaeromusa sp.]